MKGLLLCAGRGTRLRPLTYSRPKHLLPVANKPVVIYAVERMAQADIREIGLVVSPAHLNQFRRTLGSGKDWGVRLT